jgi:hypothetical protein
MITADRLGYAFTVGTVVSYPDAVSFTVCGFCVADRALTRNEAQQIANLADGVPVMSVYYWREIGVVSPVGSPGTPATGDHTIVWGN